MALAADLPLRIEERTVKKEWTAEGAAVEALLRRPVFGGASRGAGRLERHYAALEAQCLRRAEKVLLPRAAQAARGEAWSLTLDCAVTLRTERRLSLFWTVTERTGAPHPAVLCQGDTWSLPDGLALSLWDCLEAARRPTVRSLRRGVAEQCRQRLDEGYTLLFPDWERRLRSSFFPHRFYLTERGPAVFFPPNTIAPYLEGVLSFPLLL